MSRKFSKSKSNYTVIGPDQLRPEVEVRELAGNTRCGQLLAVFLGRNAEDSARAWIDRQRLKCQS